VTFFTESAGLGERDGGEAGSSCGNYEPQSAMVAKHGIDTAAM
jgi:hypothetical protein